nr:MFS transporter [Nocardioides agariphilus]
MAIGGFSIGTTEFATMGLLPDIAASIHRSIAQTGDIVSAYAFGVVIGTPLLAGLLAHLPRKGVAVVLAISLALGNGLSAVATTYPTMLVARFVAGVPHGAYFGVASLVAVSLVPQGRRGRAVSAVMIGPAVAMILGVPAATYLGQAFGWRATYWLVVAIAGAGALSILACVPPTPGDSSASPRRDLRVLLHPQVVVVVASGVVGFGGIFAMYSFIAPLVTDVAQPEAFIQTPRPSGSRTDA